MALAQVAESVRRLAQFEALVDDRLDLTGLEQPAQDLEILRRLGELRELGLTLYVSLSRKDFIGAVLAGSWEQRLGPSEREWGTVAAVTLAVILLRLYVLTPLAAGKRARGFVPAMRALRWVTRWSMVEVFMVGTLVSIVKLAGLASVIPGVGIFSYAMLTVLLAANQAAGLHGLWQRASELPP